jgi:hypothetical protein
MKMPKVIDFLGTRVAEFFNQQFTYHPTTLAATAALALSPLVSKTFLYIFLF